MYIKLGLAKLSAISACSALGFAMTQPAHADSFGYQGGGYDQHYSFSLGLGSGFYSDDAYDSSYSRPYYEGDNDEYGYGYGDYYQNNEYYGGQYHGDDLSYGYGRGDYDRDDRYRWNGDGDERDDD